MAPLSLLATQIGVHEIPGVLRLILDYAPHGSLEDRIRKHEKEGRHFTRIQVSLWVGQAAAALQYMHGERVIHRDLSAR